MPGIFTNANAGGTDGLGLAIEYDPQTATGTPGTPIAPTTYVPTTELGIDPKWSEVEPMVARGTLMSHAIDQIDRVDPTGNIGWLLNGALGLEFIQATLGGKATVSAVSGVTTASNTTANGITTLTITGAYVAGQPIEIGTGSNMVCTTVFSYAAGSLQVPQLPGALATAASGLAVSQIAVTKYANSLLTGAALSQLPVLTLEEIHQSGAWSIQYPFMQVNDLSVDFTATEIKAQAGMVGSAAPNFGNAGNTSPATFTSATYAPNATAEGIALRPMTSVNANVVAIGDPAATGTSAVQAALGVETAKVEFKND